MPLRGALPLRGLGRRFLTISRGLTLEGRATLEGGATLEGLFFHLNFVKCRGDSSASKILNLFTGPGKFIKILRSTGYTLINGTPIAAPAASVRHSALLNGIPF